MPWLRYALRLSQPLSALLPPRCRELISSHFRSWGSPFKGLFHPGCRTSSRTPRLHEVSNRPKTSDLSFEVYTAHNSPPGGLLFRQAYLRSLLGVLPLQGLFSIRVVPPAEFPPPSAPPLSCFIGLVSKLTAPPAPQGILREDLELISYETHSTSLRFHTSSAFSVVRVFRRRWAY
jgi:hypothetical protein